MNKKDKQEQRGAVEVATIVNATVQSIKLIHKVRNDKKKNK